MLQDQNERPPAQCLLRRPTNAAKVLLVQAQSIAGRKPFVRYIYGRLVALILSLPISYLGTGQHVPEDLARATAQLLAASVLGESQPSTQLSS